MTSVNIGASTGLRARLSDYKQGRKEEAAKKQGQGYLFSRLGSAALLTCTPGQQKPLLALAIS